MVKKHGAKLEPNPEIKLEINPEIKLLNKYIIQNNMYVIYKWR